MTEENSPAAAPKVGGACGVADTERKVRRVQRRKTKKRIDRP